jgi:diguanylate cyclase (GGDEF)-like protein/PAS domain S-box-containing protein
MSHLRIVRSGPLNPELRSFADTLGSGVFGTLLSRLPAISFIVDDEMFLVAVEGAALQHVAIDWRNLVGRNLILALSAVQNTAQLEAMLEDALAGQAVSRSLSGFGRDYEFLIEPARGTNGRIIGALGLALDVTEQRSIRLAMRRNEATLARTQRLAQVGSWHYDVKKKHFTVSDELLAIYRFEAGSTPSREDFLSRVHPDDREDLRGRLVAAERHATSVDGAEYRLIHPDGSERWISQLIDVACDASGGPLEITGTALDITARKALEAHLRQVAHFDATTGLPNRTQFSEHLERTLAKCARKDSLALLLVDLDEFKSINDTYGHSAGDAMLHEIGRRISSCLRREDFVARSAGDEFAVLLRNGNRTSAAALAKRIVEVCAQPLSLGDQEIFGSASIGISVAPEDATAAEQLLRNAESALHAAKTAGRHTYKHFTASMHAESVRRLGLENDLRRAIERDQLFLAYQPVVGPEGAIVSVEALVRWRHPIEGIVPPSTFIPLAEKSSLIIDIGAWVAQAACAQIAPWRKLRPGLRVALNVSARQFEDPHLAEVLAAALAGAKIGHDALDIEVTETLVVSAGHAIETLRKLRGKGARVSLDDFGTGYSSLASLKRLPIDTLKIDRSFVEQLHATDEEENSLVAAIVAVSKAMNLSTVAEGVESLAQFQVLQKLGCDNFQGFLFSRPVGEDGLTELLQQGRIVA